MPIAVATRSEVLTVLVRSNIGIVGSNPTQGMDVYVLLFYVCVVLCVGSGLATDWSLVQGVLPTVYRIKNLKKRPRSNKKAVEPQRKKINMISHNIIINRHLEVMTELKECWDKWLILRYTRHEELSAVQPQLTAIIAMRNHYWAQQTYENNMIHIFVSFFRHISIPISVGLNA
jgi:hypothetical protein